MNKKKVLTKELFECDIPFLKKHFEEAKYPWELLPKIKEIIKNDFYRLDEEEVKEEKPDYMSMPYAALKKMCAEKGLDAKGSKADLIARLDK